MLILKFQRILILGDFNIHMDKKDTSSMRDFTLFELHQVVDCPMHKKGHMLDLMIQNGTFVSQLSVSDFGLILFNLELPDIPTSTSRIIRYRKWRSIVPTVFSDFIDSGTSCILPSDALDDKVNRLYKILSSGHLDTFAPLKSRAVSFKRSAPWYNDDLRAMKTQCRKMERRWRSTGLTVYHQAWKESLGEYRTEIVSTRSTHFSQIISSKP